MPLPNKIPALNWSRTAANQDVDMGGYSIGDLLTWPDSGAFYNALARSDVIGDGVNDDYTGIQAAIAAVAAAGGGTVYLPAPSSKYLIDTGLVLAAMVNLVSEGQSATTIEYSGIGSAITLSGIGSVLLSGFTVLLTDDDANGIEIGNASRRLVINQVNIQGTNAVGTTGAGFLLDAGTGWSGGLAINHCYVLGCKYGVKMVGTSGSDTWTTVDMTDLWLVGRSAGHIANSAGIYMDADTNGVGTYLRGGTIEHFAIGVQHISGGKGGSFECDFEGNDADWELGATFNGEIILPIAGKYFRQGTNAAANKWFQEQHLSGTYTLETYYDQRHVLFGTQPRSWLVYAGDSLIEGNLPRVKFGIKTHSGSSVPWNNWMYLLGQKITYYTAAPSDGAWKKGDICFDSTPTAGVAMGWICLTTGTYSTATDNTGDTDGSTAVITGMTDTSDFDVGDYVDVSAGFPTTGPYEILAKTATSITLEIASNSAQVNITVDTTDPTWTTLPASELSKAATCAAITQGNAANQGAGYVEADVDSIADLANVNKAKINAILTALKNAKLMAT